MKQPTDLFLVMPNKPDSGQAGRFKEAARELECDEDEGRFNATLKRVMTGGSKVVATLCLCGCGHAVRINRKYLPGHDQKLRLRIEKSVGGLGALKELVEEHLGRKI